MNRRYLAVLAFVAAVVLTVGVLVRGRLRRAETPVPRAPLSEAGALQQISQESQLRRMSGYLAERTAALAPLVQYVPSVGAAGLVWTRGTVLTTRPERAVVAVAVPDADTLEPGVTLAPDTVRRDWVLVVGRRADGEVVSASGISGGRTTARCADRQLREYVLGIPLSDGFAGAGLFDLQGHALGMVVRCDDRVTAIPTSEIIRLLADTSAVTRLGRDRYGLATEPLDAQARAYFGSDSGLLVTAVRRGGAADAAGLQPGDVLLAVDGRSMSLLTALNPFAGSPDSAGRHTVIRRRGRTVATVRVAGRAPVAGARDDARQLGLGFTPATPPRGIVIATVAPASPAAEVGLRPGDRLLRVGLTSVTSAPQAARLLAAPDTTPTFVVFDRDSVAHGVLLPARP